MQFRIILNQLVGVKCCISSGSLYRGNRLFLNLASVLAPALRLSPASNPFRVPLSRSLRLSLFASTYFLLLTVSEGRSFLTISPPSCLPGA